MGAHPSARPGPRRASTGLGGRPVPGPDGGRRRGARVALGNPRSGSIGPGSLRDPDPLRGRRPAGAGGSPRPTRRGGDRRRGRAAERSPQDGVARISVSHDLRTPLATIRASAGSLLDPEIQWSTDEQRAALRSIDAEAERLNLLVRNLLDLSRIEGGALHPELEPHDLDEIVGGTVARLRPRDKTLTVQVAPTLPPVLVDDLYLDEILTNLVENAVRHGGNTIVVRAADLADASFVELVVEDDGPGAPDAALPRLFDKFFRVDQAKGTSRRGMGVGLTVVQGLARAMGGDVTAHRSELGGLAVVVRLPVAPASELAGPCLDEHPRRTPVAWRCCWSRMTHRRGTRWRRTWRSTAGSTRPPTPARRSGHGKHTGRTWSCSISASPTSTASRWCAGSVASRPPRSSSCRPGGRSGTRSPRSRRVPTTISPSHSARRSCTPASAPCCAARPARRRMPPACSCSARSPSTSAAARSAWEIVLSS